MPDDPRPSGLPLRLLVVEDEESLREVTVEVLAKAGYWAVPAEDGAQAVALFADAPESFALVILDLSMPVMDGAECFQRLRALRADVKVLLTSGYGNPGAVSGLDEALLAGYLRKPYRIAELLGAVRAILDPPA